MELIMKNPKDLKYRPTSNSPEGPRKPTDKPWSAHRRSGARRRPGSAPPPTHTSVHGSGCQIWNGSHAVIVDGRSTLPARAAFMRAHGLSHDDIPNGWRVVHDCKRTQCCNVDHLALRPPKPRGDSPGPTGGPTRPQQPAVVLEAKRVVSNSGTISHFRSEPDAALLMEALLHGVQASVEYIKQRR